MECESLTIILCSFSINYGMIFIVLNKNHIFMKLYSIVWCHNSDLSKGKGHCKELVTGYTVLCNTQSEALSCLPYHWKHHYKESSNFDPEDGEIKIQRCKIDSRGFFANYLILDRMSDPLELGSIDLSLMQYSKRYR